MLDADVRNGEALADARAYLFNPGLGGVYPEGAVGEAGTAWKVRAGTIDLLRRLGADGLEGVAVGASGAGGKSEGTGDPHAVERAGRLLASYLRYVLGAEPPTMSLVFGPRLPR